MDEKKNFVIWRAAGLALWIEKEKKSKIEKRDITWGQEGGISNTGVNGN